MKSILKFLIAIALLLSCSTKPQEEPHENIEIELAMQKYDQLLLSMNADSIASIYDVDGDLGNIAHGRDSIRNFLRSFKNIRMLSQKSTSEVVVIIADSARQEGSYTQVDVVDNDTMTVRGTYIAIWKWNNKEGWKIKRMDTNPL